MAEMSIAEAKSRFAELVHQAESGQPVRITRRGRAVAVLVSEADYARMNAGRVGLLAYTQAWRAEAAQAGLAPWGDADWAGLRDQSERPAPDLA
jgi:prevent-host-death family protein